MKQNQGNFEYKNQRGGSGGGADVVEGAVEVVVVVVTGVRPVMTETCAPGASVAVASGGGRPAADPATLAVIAIMRAIASSPSFAAEGVDAAKSISLYVR